MTKNNLNLVPNINAPDTESGATPPSDTDNRFTFNIEITFYKNRSTSHGYARTILEMFISDMARRTGLKIRVLPDKED